MDEGMDDGLVKTGIDIIGEVPWGTHFCQFYQTKEDLLDTLVPYFKAGLENNEFCMWITSDPLSAEEAGKAMHLAVSDFADRLSRGQIEILPHTDWYLKGGSFDQQRVLDGWVDKLNAAVAAGYAGLRLTGNTFWLEKQDWESFTDYEAAVNGVIGKYHMLALCTYSLDKCGATEVMDVIRNHEFALIRKEGQWEIIENAAYEQAKQAVLESEKKYRQLMESLQEGVWVIDKDAYTTFVNPRMAEMLGYSADEMLGKPLFSFIDESNLSVARERMERRRRGIKEEVEFNFRRKDGSQLWALISAAPLTDVSGQFSGVIAGIVDVTERRRSERALRESEERYRTIVETSQEGIVIGSPDGSFVFVNQRMADMLGYAKEEILGRTGLDFMDEDQKGLVTSSRRRLKEGQVVHAEYKFRRRDGSTMWTLSSASGIYDGAGEHLGNLAMHVDVTERKQAEESLRRKQSEIEALFDNSPAGLVLFDAAPPYTVLVHNKYYQELFAEPFRSRGMVGLNIYQYAPEVEAAGIVRVFDEVVRTREPKSFLDFPYESNPPKRSWFNWHILPIILDGKVVALVSMTTDVTDRHEALEALRESEAQLKKAQEIAHLGSWELDLLTNRLTWSDEAYRIFGLQPQEFDATYEGFLDAVHPDDRASVDSAYSSSLAEGRDTYAIEHRIVRRSDGEIRFVSERCEHIRDRSGRVSRSVGMVHDITERKQAEESLRETRDHLDSLLNYANAPIIVWDPEWRITKFNRAFQRLTGHSESEAVGQRLDMLFPRESREESLSQIRRAMAGERWETVEIPILRVDGEVRTVLWNSANIHAFDGVTTIATIAQGQDITERKLAEKALRESEEGYRHVFEAAMDGFWVTDLSGRLLQVNDAYCQMSGYTRQELLGMRVSDVDAVEKPEETAEHIKRVLSQGQDRFETRHRHKDGKLIDIEVSVKYSDIRGGQLIVSARDITERKQAEKAVQMLNETLRERAQLLEAANKELESFAYSVSHDLRAPLRSIDGFSLALLEDYASKLDDEGKDYLQRVRAASQMMGQLIDDMLELSRISRTELHWKKLDLSALTQKIARELQGSDRRRQAEFVVAPNLSVYGDAPLLRAALENLLSNAWKFTGKRGMAKIEFGAVKKDGERVYFVRDNGAGFDMKYVGKIFEPFQRLHSKNEFSGTGVGLATVRRIINRHGGRIWAEGKVGDGATFYFTLSENRGEE